MDVSPSSESDCLLPRRKVALSEDAFGNIASTLLMRRS